MMKTFLLSVSCLALTGIGMAAPAQAQQSGSVVVSFLGPGGHSNGNYGRTNALHAAARSIVTLGNAGLPAGSYSLSGLAGGNSVNSIAGDAEYVVTLRASDASAYQALVSHVTAAAQAGASAENAFRGVAPGDLTAGAPADVRVTVTPR